tara:strand:+ start:523 stop:837 length:315 start_codon:yes stop_codon:yes gene_type:complete
MIEIPRYVVEDLDIQTENGGDDCEYGQMLRKILATQNGREFTISTREQAQAVFDSATHLNETARGEISDGDYTEPELADYREMRDDTYTLRRALKALGFKPEAY